MTLANMRANGVRDAAAIVRGLPLGVSVAAAATIGFSTRAIIPTICRCRHLAQGCGVSGADT
jgi:hypothetical protein